MTSVRIARKRAFQRVHPSGGNFTPQGAAHNYQVEVSLSGAVDPSTGLILNIREIDSLIDEVLASNADAATSTESFARVLFENLRPPVQSRRMELCKLRLYESAEYWVDVWP